MVPVLHTRRGLGNAPDETCIEESKEDGKSPRWPRPDRRARARPTTAAQAWPACSTAPHRPHAHSRRCEPAPTLPHSQLPRPDRVTLPGKTGISSAAVPSERTGPLGLVKPLRRSRSADAQGIRGRTRPDGSRGRVHAGQKQHQRKRCGWQPASHTPSSFLWRSITAGRRPVYNRCAAVLTLGAAR